MAWLLAHDPRQSVEDRRFWLTEDQPRHGSQLLPKGTLVLEFETGPGDRRPVQLASFERNSGWHRHLVVYLNADRSVSVAHRQGQSECYVRLSPFGPEARRLRLSYSWDGPARKGTLTLECTETGLVTAAEFSAPLPISWSDAAAIVSGLPGPMRFDAQVRHVSLCDHKPVVGPSATISPEALVATPDGLRPMGSLRLGDQVSTLTSGPRPVRWILQDERPAMGFERRIVLRAPYLGLTRNLEIAASQRLQLSVPDSNYVIGREQAHVSAEMMLAHPAASETGSTGPSAWRQLLLDTHDCILVNGMWLETAFVGRLADHPDLVALSHFAELGASALPVHHRPVARQLQPFEANTMVRELTA